MGKPVSKTVDVTGLTADQLAGMRSAALRRLAKAQSQRCKVTANGDARHALHVHSNGRTPAASVDPEAPALDWVSFKIAERCNINCSYCYVYNRGDSSWKTRPKLASEAIALALRDRAIAHCAKHGIEHFDIEFHGGEPLLIGKPRLRRIMSLFREKGASPFFRFHLQTNGLLLDEEWLELFAEFGLTFGISMDGPASLADRYRVDHQGNGTSERLLATFNRLSGLPTFRKTFGGALCVLSDPDADPKTLIDWFIDHGVRAFDFLLPDANYASPLAGPDALAKYRSFLVSAFDYWISLEKGAPSIRIFELVLRGMTGERTGLDAVAGDLSASCVVESDGTIGAAEGGRLCPPLRVDRLNILSDDLDRHVDAYRMRELLALSDTCIACPHANSCHGGYLSHRFDGESFRNPSYYCSVLFALCDHAFDCLTRELEIPFDEAESRAGALP